VGAAGDNTRIESFHSLLQNNVLNSKKWESQEELRIAIVNWIEGTYHHRRRKRSLGKMRPDEYGQHMKSLTRSYLLRETTYTCQLNRQQHRQAERWNTISTIANRFKNTHAIETGTYLGSTTPYISSLVSEATFTIEINAKTEKKARKCFEKNHARRNIHLIHGDSVQEIKVVLKNIDPAASRVLAYLDAHWLDKIPTIEEITSLVEWGGPWIAIIDDFNVPLDNGYGFDHCGDVIIGPMLVPKLEELHVYSLSRSL
jgi:predicted O-methyltransferase YrrM